MKKQILLTAVLFLLPTLTFATSGACSGHGGVSCSAGIDNDGSVICNDGWRNSSVSYASMKMCQGYTQEMPAAIPVIQSELAPAPIVAPAPIIKKVQPTPVKVPKSVATTSVASSSKPVPISHTATSSSVIPKKEVTSVPRVEKRGFWSRLFSSIF